MEINMIPILKKLGVKKIFNGTTDISNMSSSKESINISIIKQKVKIIVEENGTEASAATIIAGVKTGARRKPISKTYNFVADHPFTYYIVHVPSQIILFSGMYL